MTSEMAAAIAAGEDPRGHRLQRQDAKSRKTFKIKRATTKTSKRPRFMSHRRRPDADAASTAEGSPSRTAVVFHEQSNAFSLRMNRKSSGLARSVETIPESVEVKVFPNAARV